MHRSGLYSRTLLASSMLACAYAQQTTPPSTIAAVAAGSGTTTSNIAPGSIFTITGTNLATSTTTNGSVMGSMLPTTLAGVQVTISGTLAALFSVSPAAISAQVPFEVQPGSQQLQVVRDGTAVATATVTVATTAPALFFDGTGLLALKFPNYSIVGAVNPAAPGELVLLYATGLGQTTPLMQTGVPVPSSALGNAAFNASRVTVQFGDVSAEPLHSVAAPGFAGLYQIAVRIPSTQTGTIPVSIQTGGASSSAGTLITGRVAGGNDRQVQAVFAEYQALRPKPVEALTPQEARTQPTFADAVRALQRRQGGTGDPEAIGGVEERMIPGGDGVMIPARIYTPQGTGPFPVIVYFHGGGFVIATRDTYDASARALANEAAAVVVSVEYRKAPENPFPAATEDAYAAVQWAFANTAAIGGQPDRVAVAGESAGGNLATVVCMMARDRRGRMPVHQALVYPVTNLASESPSYEENGKALFLTRDALRWFGGHYLSTPQGTTNPYASPLLGSVQGLPPATVITAGLDPLRSEGAAYADKLRQFGIVVDYRNYETMSHEFFGMNRVVDEGRRAVQHVAANLRVAFGL
ncbi:MAG: alpha/beta hydrolase fold domain-containing protein [Bryobacteraceae bacterium]|nr:alpha/beta hydrolase fold domain-containing protein [Bryobacteraceae bacterium]